MFEWSFKSLKAKGKDGPETIQTTESPHFGPASNPKEWKAKKEKRLQNQYLKDTAPEK